MPRKYGLNFPSHVISTAVSFGSFRWTQAYSFQNIERKRPMHTTHLALAPAGRTRFGGLFAAILLISASAGSLQAQEAIGVPFVGKNHLSFYTTQVSRDGAGDQRAALYGGIYGRRFGDRAGKGEVSLSLRAGARSFDGTDDGIFDSALTLAATRSVPRLKQLNLTAAAGVGLMAWGQTSPDSDIPDSGHLSLRVPVSAGLSYDVRIGSATFAPFATIIPAYSSERDYVDDDRVSTDGGWKVGGAFGVTARFRETVFSISGIHRERGMPHANRVAFSAGMSW